LAFDDPPDDLLTARFHKLLPSQIPANFAISTPPNEILCWATQVSQIAKLYLMENKKGVTREETEPGEDGWDSAASSATRLTPSSLCYPLSSKRSLSDPSLASIALPPGTPTVNLPAIVRSQWSRVLCAKPQATWLRRSGSVSGRVPCTSRGLPTCDHKSEPC
jgi:hypothetical protein